MEIAIGILLILAAIFLVVAVLMQSGKSHNLSGTIAGGAETFFGKSKATTIDKKLSKLTTIVAIVFVILVLVSYFMQDTVDIRNLTAAPVADTTSAEVVDSTADAVEEAVADAAEGTEEGGN